MSVLKGLQAIQDVLQEEQDRKDRPKVPWLNVKDGQQVKIWFLNEMDEGSKRYNDKAGTVIFVPEHPKPGDFRTKCMCTAGDEGACVGCERYRAGNKDWKARVRMYANVLVEEAPGAERKVAVMNQGMGSKAITEDLIEFAKENGGITQFAWRLKRKGDGRETQWTISAVIGEEGVDPEDYDLLDLEETVVWRVPYEKQEEFFDKGGYQKKDEPAEVSHDQVW